MKACCKKLTRIQNLAKPRWCELRDSVCVWRCVPWYYSPTRPTHLQISGSLLVPVQKYVASCIGRVTIMVTAATVPGSGQVCKHIRGHGWVTNCLQFQHSATQVKEGRKRVGCVITRSTEEGWLVCLHRSTSFVPDCTVQAKRTPFFQVVVAVHNYSYKHSCHTNTHVGYLAHTETHTHLAQQIEGALQSPGARIIHWNTMSLTHSKQFLHLTLLRGHVVPRGTVLEVYY